MIKGVEIARWYSKFNFSRICKRKIRSKQFCNNNRSAGRYDAVCTHIFRKRRGLENRSPGTIYLLIYVSGRITTLRYFSSQQAMKQSLIVTATHAYVSADLTGPALVFSQTNLIIFIQWPPGEIFLVAYITWPLWVTSKGLQSQKFAMFLCSVVLLFPCFNTSMASL